MAAQAHGEREREIVRQEPMAVTDTLRLDVYQNMACHNPFITSTDYTHYFNRAYTTEFDNIRF